MTDQEIRRALDVGNKAMAIVQKLLEPLESEMRINNWGSEYREIMWGAVRLEATGRMKEAAAEAKKEAQ